MSGSINVRPATIEHTAKDGDTYLREGLDFGHVFSNLVPVVDNVVAAVERAQGVRFQVVIVLLQQCQYRLGRRGRAAQTAADPVAVAVAVRQNHRRHGST